MPESSLKPLPPLGGEAPRSDQFGDVQIVENTGTALASVAMRLNREADFAKSAKKLFGFAMPGPGHVVTGKTYDATWIGVDQWLIEAPFDTHEDIARFVKGGLGDTASITEQTDGWARFDISGPGMPAVLERLSAIDIHAMQTGTASRTLIEHLGCIVICRQARHTVSILGPRSSAASLHHALVAAAKSVA